MFKIGQVVEIKILEKVNDQFLKSTKIDKPIKMIVVGDAYETDEGYKYIKGHEIETMNEIIALCEDCKICNDIPEELQAVYNSYAKWIHSRDLNISKIESLQREADYSESKSEIDLEEIVRITKGIPRPKEVYISIKNEFKTNFEKSIPVAQYSNRKLLSKFENYKTVLVDEICHLSAVELLKEELMHKGKNNSLDILNVKNCIRFYKESINECYALIDVYQKELKERNVEFQEITIPSYVKYTRIN